MNNDTPEKQCSNCIYWEALTTEHLCAMGICWNEKHNKLSKDETTSRYECCRCFEKEGLDE